MIRYSQVYSLTLTLKMREQQKRAKKVKAGIRDLLFIALVFLVGLSIISNIRLGTAVAKADEVINNTKPVIQKETVRVPVAVAKEDPRVTKLQAFLISKGSPLTPYAPLIISEADRWDIGWTKIVSIAGMESNFGKKVPTGSYNAWGLGGSHFMYFSSWEKGISYVSQLLGTNYKKNEYQAIKANYCPASDKCNPLWAEIITAQSRDILSLGE